MSTEYHEIRLTRPAALGNGTREAGETLCRLILAPGVQLGEALTALRNPKLFTISGGDPPPPKDREPEPAKEDGPRTETPLAGSKIPIEYHRPLVGAGIYSVEDLIRFREQNPLTAIDGIGRKSAEAIEAALQ